MIVADIVRQHPRIHEVVEQVRAVYPGGQPFFTTLDASLRRPEFFRLALDQAKISPLYRQSERGTYVPEDPTIVLSGKFGEAMRDWLWKEHQIDALLVEGDVRHGGLTPLGRDRVLKGGLYVFIDDSLYRGRTRAQIGARLSDVGGKLIRSVVLYDGAHEPVPNVDSLYRWRDRDQETDGSDG